MGRIRLLLIHLLEGQLEEEELAGVAELSRDAAYRTREVVARLSEGQRIV